MLEIVRYNQDEYDFPCLLVLGCFDGLHIGHAELLKKAKLQAKINGLDLGVMLFADGKGGENLYSFEERVAFLEQYNAKFVLKIDFNEEFKQIKPLEFLECLEDKLNVKAYMSGKDFRFGNGKKGKASTLKNYAEDEENGVWYMSVNDVKVNSEKVGTSNIKTLLQSGNVREAGELLGRNYSVSGTVIKGAGRGNEMLGFPTANIEYPENRFEIKHGVYKVNCFVDDVKYQGIANFGIRPTFDEDKPLLETYIDGFDGSLYGKNVKVEFVDYIRDIVKFDSAAALTARLKLDLSSLDNGNAVSAAENVKTASVHSAVSESEEKKAQPSAETALSSAQAAEEEPKTEVKKTSVENAENADKTFEVEEILIGEVFDKPVEAEEIFFENGQEGEVTGD